MMYLQKCVIAKDYLSYIRTQEPGCVRRCFIYRTSLIHEIKVFDSSRSNQQHKSAVSSTMHTKSSSA